MKNDSLKWHNEYELFLKSEDCIVPEELSLEVNTTIMNLLNPNAFFVFLKTLVIHLVVGFLSLSVCHQFGMNPFNTSFSLAEWFMKVGGYYTCMIGCGVTFLSLSIFVAGLVLSAEEVNSLSRTEFLQNLSLGLISLGIFAIFGVELAIGMAVLWLLGSVIGGFVATKLVSILKWA